MDNQPTVQNGGIEVTGVLSAIDIEKLREALNEAGRLRSDATMRRNEAKIAEAEAIHFENAANLAEKRALELLRENYELAKSSEDSK